MATYTFRKSVLTKPETYSVTEDGLGYTFDGVNFANCPYQNIKSLRLIYFPTRLKTNNYCCEITLNVPEDLKIKIPSISYVSFGEFEDGAINYNTFVKELSKRISQNNPLCKFYAGKPLWKFVLENTLVLLFLAFLFWILSVFSSAISGIVVLRIFIVGLSLYYIIKAFTINLPKEFDPLAIQEKLLPS
ncbi:hypothetical protein [Pedobacter frigiditerrae]|uniref:hypothetical protein n=1 Tax=Pedobacter frigiditerrae TaxID=2530452 RepID=UPI00292D9607|nr:hypothetical protein [Pedobacter frigiditerrae]